MIRRHTNAFPSGSSLWQSGHPLPVSLRAVQHLVWWQCMQSRTVSAVVSSASSSTPLSLVLTMSSGFVRSPHTPQTSGRPSLPCTFLRTISSSSLRYSTPVPWPFGTWLSYTLARFRTTASSSCLSVNESSDRKISIDSSYSAAASAARRALSPPAPATAVATLASAAASARLASWSDLLELARSIMARLRLTCVGSVAPAPACSREVVPSGTDSVDAGGFSSRIFFASAISSCASATCLRLSPRASYWSSMPRSLSPILPIVFAQLRHAAASAEISSHSLAMTLAASWCLSALG
mmetsp:Transcript_6375/g.26438  ORF Transcript_6375/g.26438 Transcript_6375/m.26438 type:complete len:295 (+) Transcript_6375:1347-2231(+)